MTEINRNQCYNCGGDLGKRDGRIVCLHCGTYMPEQISSEEAMLLTSACQKLRLADFSEAEQEFEDIVRRHPKCAQGYWGRLLAKYGIKYEEDYDGSRIPTCYAASIESVYDASDYKKSLEYADEENRAVFREHAAYIERVRLEWVEKASKEPPYDIFISYKDSDREHGIKRTQDSYAMQDLYFRLKEKGYRVFFSHESLRDKTGEKYEPYIYGALSTAKVMLVYGSKPEYINATWVKNEWTRYKKRMQAGEKKNGSLLVAYEGFAPKELPGALSSLQCLDAGEKIFYTDLFAAIDRILKADTETVSPASSAGAICVHKPMTVPAQAPTCTEDGRTEITICALCGETLKKPEILPATGHRFSEWRIARKASCTEDGLHERVCACGEKETKIIPARGSHVPGEWETVRAPAPGKEGLKVRKCVLCGAHTEEQDIPALSGVQKADIHPPVQKASRSISQPAQKITPCSICGSTEFVTSFDGRRKCKFCGTVYEPSSLRLSIGNVYEPSLLRLSIGNACPVCGGSLNLSGGVLRCRYCGTAYTAPISPSEGLKFRANADGKTCAITGIGTCKDTDVVIPETIKSYGAVYQVTEISASAFQWNKTLKNICIPASVTKIGNSAFCGSGEILVSETNPNFRSDDGNLYSNDGKTLLYYAASKEARAFTVPPFVNAIGDHAFYHCKNLFEIKIGNHVKDIGRSAFSACDSITEITIPGNVGVSAFSYCKNLTSVKFLGPVKRVPGALFSGCHNLTSVTLPSSVTSIEDEAFGYCTKLTAIRFDGTKKQWKNIDLHKKWKANSAIRSVECSDGTVKFLF